MEFTGPIPPSPSPAPTRGDAQISAWQVGQVLKAVTVSQQVGGQTLLQIGNQQVQGQSPLPLQAGQPLEVEVRALQPQVVLRLLPQAGKPVSADLKAEQVRTLLPKQDSMAPLMRNLNTLVNARETPLPPLVQALSRNLIRQLPDPASVSHAAGLRKAVEQSGLFLESRLQASGQGARIDFNTDIKVNLLRLVQLLRNWPGLSSSGAGNGRPSNPASPPPNPSGVATTPATPTPGAQGSGTPATPTAQSNPAATTPASGGPATPQGTVASARGASAQTGTPPRTMAPPNPATSTLNTALPSATEAGKGAQPPLTARADSPLFTTPPPPPQRGQAPIPMARDSAQRLPGLNPMDPASLLRPELQKQAEAAVARVQLTQLASLPQDRASGLEWLLDLPIRRGTETDLWSLQIRYGQDENTRNAREQTAGWTVYLAFDLPGLGPMQARVSLRGEEISTAFWATEAGTVPYLQEHLRELREHLEEAGLTVAELQCHRGSMPSFPTPSGSRASLLDEHI